LQTKWKKPVILSKQPIVLYLGVFGKVWKLFWMVCCQTKTTDWFALSTDCLFEILTETVLLVKWALNDFITEYALALNALTNIWKL